MSLNQELSEIYAEMSTLYTIRGEQNDGFRANSYRKAAETFEYLREDITILSEQNSLDKIKGIGKAISEKTAEYIRTGKIKAYEELKKSFPKGLLELLHIPSLGPKKVAVLWHKKGVTNMKKLKIAIEKGELLDLDGFGEKSVDNIAQGIKILATLQDRTPLGFIYPLVQEMYQYISAHKSVTKIETAGSFRRKEETIGDIDFLCLSENPVKLINYFCEFSRTQKILAQGETKGSIILEEGKQVDLRVVKPDEWGAALQYFTGSKEHNVHTRAIAKSKGLKINEYGVFKVSDDSKVAGKTEEEVYQSFGLEWVPPELRTDTGEIDAAMSDQLPKRLVESTDIKGDLHTHTTWSDGKNTIDEMCEAAIDSGLEYIAITDHSPTETQANGMSVERLLERRIEIKEAQKKFSKLRILEGTEVDILADGSLDYQDDILESLDIVVASIHSGFKKDNTERIIKAMENPNVHIIGHLSGRHLGKRESYPLNYEKVFEAAVRTSTLIEINSQPVRSDISWKYIKLGKEMGVKFVINTDSHSVETLWFRELGAAQARKGWLEKSNVANTRSTKEFLKIVKT